MRIGTYDLTTPAVNDRMNITSDAHLLMCKVKYKGARIANDILLAQSEDTRMADLARALQGGKITLTYSAAGLSKGKVMIPNRPLIDVAELNAAAGNIIAIRHVSDGALSGETYSIFEAAFPIVVSQRGTIPLGENNKLILEFSNFSNNVVNGGTAVHCDTGIIVDTVVSFNRDNVLNIIEPINSQPSASTSFDISDRSLLFIPADTDRLTLNSFDGTAFDLINDSLRSFAETQTAAHIFACGMVEHYYNWICLPAIGYRNGQIQLLSSDTIYAMSNYLIQ